MKKNLIKRELSEAWNSFTEVLEKGGREQHVPWRDVLAGSCIAGEDL